MSFVENAARWKEKTGTVRENTRNAFAGRAKPRDLLFSRLHSMLSTIHSSMRDYFGAEICIIVYCYYENAFFFSRAVNLHLY